MNITEAIKALEEAQKILAPVLEDAINLSSNESLKDSISTAINLCNICAEDLTDSLIIDEFLGAE